jgi:hypothetical protein
MGFPGDRTGDAPRLPPPPPPPLRRPRPTTPSPTTRAASGLAPACGLPVAAADDSGDAKGDPRCGPRRAPWSEPAAVDTPRGADDGDSTVLALA